MKRTTASTRSSARSDGCCSRTAACSSGAPPATPSGHWSNAGALRCSHRIGRWAWPRPSPPPRGTGLAFAHPSALPVAGPVLLLWCVSPAIAWWVSRPLARRSSRLTLDQLHFLRKLARKTWAYFETYVGPDDHWLPPDNVQETPAVGVAHRTSPTNMGLALLANLAAHDFGYLSTGQLVERTANAFDTMASLERHRGHFYNWYDTQTLLPLAPLYVSTVDSGNLAGHLLTLRPGLANLPDAAILNRRWVEGVRDTYAILVDAAGKDAPDDVAQFAQFAQFDSALALASAAGAVPLASAWVHVDRLAASSADVAAHFTAEPTAGPQGDAGFWAEALARQCADMRNDLLFLAPWLALQAASGTGPDPTGTGTIPTLREIAALGVLEPICAEGAARAAARIAAIDQLALQATTFATMDYDFLFDKVRRQLVIGYNVADRRSDTSYYDLLASEARLCNFVAIAQGSLPQESWFSLGRLLTAAGREPVLLSWSGSMFEYLMPLLVMPNFENSLLDQTYRASVARQIEYGRQRGVPWGMSESGYNTVDVHQNYQYRAFGVPGLGLKRGLGDDVVVAPYASALALMVAPEEACLNLQRLSANGLAGTLGLFEAIDYTPSRQRRGESSAVVRSYMAHHQAMSFLSCAYLLLGQPMQKRFESDPLLQATLLLLQERIPRVTLFHSNAPDLSNLRAAGGSPESPVRVLASPDTAIPEVQLLSNGRYHVMVTNCRWRKQPLERPGRVPLARGLHVRQLGNLLLHPRRGERGILVNRVPAHVEAGRPLRGDLFGGPGGVPAPGLRSRDAHGNRGFARRRHRDPPGPHHQPRTKCPDTRRDELCGSGSGAGGGRRIASGLQQSLRPDRDRQGSQGDTLHASSAVPRRACTVDVSPDDAAWRSGPGNIVRNGPHAVHRPPRLPCGTARNDGSGQPCEHRGLGTGSDRGNPPSHHHRSRGHGDDRHGHGGRRDARRPTEPRRQVPGSQSRRSRVRTGVDAQPGGAAATQRHRGRFAALCPACRLRPVCQCVVACCGGRAGQEPAHAVRALGLRNFGRPAHRPAAGRRHQPISNWCANSCRRTPTGG